MKRIIVGLVLLGLLFSVGGCGKDDMPSFAETTNESVLLKYDFIKGQEKTGVIEIDLDIKAKMMGQNINLPVRMLMQLKNRIKDVDDKGIASIETVVTRIKMALDMLGMVSIDFDSDNGNQGNSKYEAFWKLLNKPFNVKVNPRGQMVDMDLTSLLGSLSGGMSSKLLGNMNPSLSQLNNSAFFSFPENPVKAGDIHDSFSMEQQIPNIGGMKISMKYQVVSIAKDKKKVILKPIFNISLETEKSSPLKLSLKSDKSEGWLIFNLEASSIEKMNFKMGISFKMEHPKQKIDLKMDMDINYKEEVK